MFRNRVRTYALIGAAAVAGVLAVVLPAQGDDHAYVEFVASSSTSPRFVLEGSSDSPQLLETARNGCQIVSDEELIDLQSNGNTRPGLNNLSLGVKGTGSNSNGTPCSQVDGTETLTLAPGSALSGEAFTSVQFDVEMTGDAIVTLTFVGSAASDTYELHTGTNFTALCATTQGDGSSWPGCEPDADASAPSIVDTPTGIFKSACAAPNSSGPNSGANDNCVWSADPGYEFTSVVLSVKNVGTVSLEGGADTGISSKLYLAQNLPPVANDQDVFVDYTEDTSGEPVAAPAFTLDVSDPNGDTLQFPTFPMSTVEGGTLNRVGLSVTYTPPKDFTGSDSFSYTVSDGEFSDSATVTIYEVLDCGETLTVSGDGIVAEYERLFPEEGGCDVAKPYDVEIVPVIGEDSVVQFQPKPREGDPVPDCSVVPDDDAETPDAGDCTDEFLGTLSFGTEGETNAPTTGTLEYDPVVRDDVADAEFRAMSWCEFDPTEAVPTGYDERRDALPEGESWCIIEVNVSIADSSNTITTWYVYGIGDPFKRLS